MDQANDISATGADGREKSGRGVWNTPKLARLRAHGAEAGANPIVTEGQFGKGS